MRRPTFDGSRVRNPGRSPRFWKPAEFLVIGERHFAHLSKRKGRYRILCRLPTAREGIACDDAAAMHYGRSSGAGARKSTSMPGTIVARMVDDALCGVAETRRSLRWHARILGASQSHSALAAAQSGH